MTSTSARRATGALPSDRTVVVERFRDEIGDWRLCVLTPFGGRVHSAWAMALRARIRRRLGIESTAIWSDDGIIVHLPDADTAPGAELVLVDPDEIEDLVVAELGDSALFGARFRENAARALLIPRAYPGRRIPLWQQRLKSQTLLQVVRRHPQFPIVLETYRECLQDVLDMRGLIELLRKLQTGEISLVEVETAGASPFAGSLLFDYVATYMYEGDAPSAERRAAALALDRDLLRELLGQEELRELIDKDALQQVEDDLQRRSPHARARSADTLHDLLRGLGDLTPAEIGERSDPPEAAGAWLEELAASGRAAPLIIAGEQRWIAADDAGLFRDALGAPVPAHLPPVLLADVPDALERLVLRFAHTHGPFPAAALRGRYGPDLTPTLVTLERDGRLVRGELRPGGSEREWCDPDVLRRLRRASLAVLRHEVEPVERRALASFAADWQGIDGNTATDAGVDRLRRVLVSLQALPLPVETWERDVLPRRLGAYSPAWLDQLCMAGELIWIGAGALGGRGGRVALYFREDAALLGPPPAPAQRPAEDVHNALRERLLQGACFYADILVDCPQFGPSELHAALWELVWAGEVTNDSFSALRSPRRPAATPAARGGVPAGARFSRRRYRGTARPQGRWSLTTALLRDAVDAGERRRAQAELLLERHGIVTRELLASEVIGGGFSALYEAFSNLETLGIARRGYFIEGLGGAQFALPEAVERLRAGAKRGGAAPILLAALDPAQPYGAALRWPSTPGRPPTRQAGNYVVLADGEPLLSVEGGGRALHVLCDAADARLPAAFTTLTQAVHRGLLRRLLVERIDGGPAHASRHVAQLMDLGFRVTPRGVALSG